MRLDAENTFSSLQAITSTGATASSNVIDLGAGGKRKGGAGGLEPLEVFVAVRTAFTSGGSATMSVTLQSDDDEAFGSPTAVAVTDAIPVASLVAGYEFERLSLAKVTERYVRLVFTVGTAAMTAGNVNATLIPASSIQRGVGQAA